MFCFLSVGYGDAVAVHDTESENTGEFLYRSLGFDRVAGRVERRRESRYTEHSGNDTEHSAADAALCRNARGE